MSDVKTPKEELLAAPLATKIAYAQLVQSVYSDNIVRHVIDHLELDPVRIFGNKLKIR